MAASRSATWGGLAFPGYPVLRDRPHGVTRGRMVLPFSQEPAPPPPPPPPPPSIPVVGNFDPTPGTQITGATRIAFDVTDDHGLTRVLVYNGAELIWDGAFAALYSGSFATPISGGIHFSLSRSGGWTAAPQISVVAVNVDGQEAS